MNLFTITLMVITLVAAAVSVTLMWTGRFSSSEVAADFMLMLAMLPLAWIVIDLLMVASKP